MPHIAGDLFDQAAGCEEVWPGEIASGTAAVKLSPQAGQPGSDAASRQPEGNCAAIVNACAGATSNRCRGAKTSAACTPASARYGRPGELDASLEGRAAVEVGPAHARRPLLPVVQRQPESLARQEPVGA